VSDSPTLIGRDRVQRHNLIGSAPGLQSHTVQAFTPSWIAYRHSLVLVDRREDAGETVLTCRACGCEADVIPAPHSPRCPVVAERVWSRPEVEASMTAWAGEHDEEAPRVADWHSSTDEHPSAQEVKALYCRWNVAVEAAGLAPTVAGRRRRTGATGRVNGTDEAEVGLALVEGFES
jgi:hypothetical protein